MDDIKNYGLRKVIIRCDIDLLTDIYVKERENRDEKNVEAHLRLGLANKAWHVCLNRFYARNMLPTFYLPMEMEHPNTLRGIHKKLLNMLTLILTKCEKIRDPIPTGTKRKNREDDDDAGKSKKMKTQYKICSTCGSLNSQFTSQEKFFCQEKCHNMYFTFINNENDKSKKNKI